MWKLSPLLFPFFQQSHVTINNDTLNNSVVDIESSRCQQPRCWHSPKAAVPRRWPPYKKTNQKGLMELISSGLPVLPSLSFSVSLGVVGTFCFAVTFHLCAWFILLNKLESKQICPSPLLLALSPRSFSSSLRRLLWFMDGTFQSKYSQDISCINMLDFPSWEEEGGETEKKYPQSFSSE